MLAGVCAQGSHLSHGWGHACHFTFTFLTESDGSSSVSYLLTLQIATSVGPCQPVECLSCNKMANKVYSFIYHSDRPVFEKWLQVPVGTEMWNDLYNILFYKNDLRNETCTFSSLSTRTKWFWTTLKQIISRLDADLGVI